MKKYYGAIVAIVTPFIDGEVATPFIEFMLARILESLDELLSQTRPGQADYSQRVEFGLNDLRRQFCK